MRLFFAVELPPEVQAELGRLRPADSGDYRWVEPAKLHVTLAFLGQQPAERLEVLRDVGRAAATAGQAGVLRLGDTGSFGSRTAPRVLWVGLDGDVAALAAVQAQLNARLRKAGVQLEDRPFRPHITLARRRESARPGAPPGWPPPPGPNSSPAQPRPHGPAFRMHSLTLFESRLDPRGATYIALAEFPLGPSPNG